MGPRGVILSGALSVSFVVCGALGSGAFVLFESVSEAGMWVGVPVALGTEFPVLWVDVGEVCVGVGYGCVDVCYVEVCGVFEGLLVDLSSADDECFVVVGFDCVECAVEVGVYFGSGWGVVGAVA